MKSKNKEKVRSASTLTQLWKSLVTELFDTYRPERHYMRGPGPKWREKHLPRAAVDMAPFAEAVEVRA